MGFNNGSGQVKPQPGAFGLAGHIRSTVETVKDMGNIFGVWIPGPLVAYTYNYIILADLPANLN